MSTALDCRHLPGRRAHVHRPGLPASPRKEGACPPPWIAGISQKGGRMSTALVFVTNAQWILLDYTVTNGA